MSHNLRIRRFSLIAILTIFSACAIQAQSGRRHVNPPPSAPVPTPTPEPTPIPKKQSDEPEVTILLTMYRNDNFAYYPSQFANTVLSACGERLRTASSAIVDISGNDVTRGEAVKKANGETKAFVVWLQLTTSTMGSAASSTYADIELEYTVFEPTTAKTVTSGRTYQGATRKGPVTIGTPSSRGANNAIYAERLLRYAAEDAADRIIRALHVSSDGPNHP